MKNSTSYQIFNESGILVPFGIKKLEYVIRRMEIEESCRFKAVEVVFINDDEILKINRTYLNHDYITDIITFPYHEKGDNNLEGTLYCCAPQIKRQCREYGSTYEMEVLRVVVHGLLHLAGYLDDTPSAENGMRELENRYITLYQDN